MSLYSEYYLNSAQNVVELDLIEIEHFRFSPTIFRLVRNWRLMELSTNDAHGNPKFGVIVTHEGGAGPFEYEFVPMKIEYLGSGNDLDQSYKVTIGDLGSIIPAQMSRVRSFNAMNVKPIFRYRSYRSDNLLTPLTPTPSVLEIKRISFNKEGCSFEAVAPYLNATQTGVLYNRKNFPMMKAFFNNT